jgi:protein-S-isoprenylcysteine O-methyltransferase Ste14
MLLPLSQIVSYKISGMFFLMLGLMVGFLAILKHPRNNFNIRPDIKENCILMIDGIYAYMRHPMYFSVIVSMLGILLLRFSILELALYIFLLINMMVKMFYEESLWHCEGREYEEYAKNTKRLIPYIF